MANQTNEYATDLVTNAVIWTREAGQKDKSLKHNE